MKRRAFLFSKTTALLLLLFLLVPAVELLILMRLAGSFGFWPTACLVLSTGLLGAGLTRREGLRVLARVRLELREGRMPTGEILEGLMVLVAGAFLLTPGLLTDLCGFTLLVPGIRETFAAYLGRLLVRKFSIGKPEVIDAEWSRTE